MTIRKLPDQPGFMIRRLQQVAISLFHETLETAEITPVQYTILQILSQNRQLDQTAIAALAYLDASTTGDVLRRLEKRDLVCRTVKETDRRSRVVDITEDGTDLLTRLRGRITESQHYLLSPLTAQEQTDFLDYVTRILAFHEPQGEADYPTSPWQRGA
ncbi:hypothetical protein A3731_29235 [Roseovarius sp. HI0049]|nr:hypothetical protein A3731_29235 [Roseovarius sp. HI0049]